MKFERMTMTEMRRAVIQRMQHPQSFQNSEQMMAERGVFVDHSTLHRWSIKLMPGLTALG
jgi:transposase-like protein